jgi:hypothetical protein
LTAFKDFSLEPVQVVFWIFTNWELTPIEQYVITLHSEFQRFGIKGLEKTLMSGDGLLGYGFSDALQCL